LYYVERLDKGAFTGFSNHIRAKLSAARPRGDNVAHTRSLLDCRHSNIIDTYAISPLTVVAIQCIQPTAAESFSPVGASGAHGQEQRQNAESSTCVDIFSLFPRHTCRSNGLPKRATIRIIRAAISNAYPIAPLSVPSSTTGTMTLHNHSTVTPW
jgi:hypothetical protein